MSGQLASASLLHFRGLAGATFFSLSLSALSYYHVDFWFGRPQG